MQSDMVQFDFASAIRRTNNRTCFVSTMSHLSILQLLGVDEQHLLPVPGHAASVRMHRQVIAPISELIDAAAQAGFDLRIASGFRSFERQLHIWNNKCLGRRPVLDMHGTPLKVEQLSLAEKVHAILYWSALPGASRHHWGTDCDIYDASAVDDDYIVQLHPDEYTGSGPFAPMMQWLQGWFDQQAQTAFYRPYWCNPHSGIASEPWHISYYPLSKRYEPQLSVQALKDYWCSLGDGVLEEKEYLLNELDTIYHQYIQTSPR